MSDELKRLEEQVRRAFEGEAWHGPAVLETFSDIPIEAVAAHPIASGHSIWEIVLHLTATYRLVLQRSQGHSGNLSAAQDWPAVANPDAAHWHAAIEELRRLNQEVRLAILGFDKNRLDQPIAAGHSSAYVHFAGIPQHDAYHAGQIAILRKALAR